MLFLNFSVYNQVTNDISRLQTVGFCSNQSDEPIALVPQGSDYEPASPGPQGSGYEIENCDSRAKWQSVGQYDFKSNIILQSVSAFVKKICTDITGTTTATSQ